VNRQNWAYAAYAAGSTIFVFLAISRGSVLLAVGSALFLLGTLLLVVPQVTRRHRGRHEAGRVRWVSPTRGGAAR
jgi:hypothetical protein